MSDREKIAEHLRFFEELGVEGISRDPVWSVRAVDRVVVQKSPEQSDVAALVGQEGSVPADLGQGLSVKETESEATYSETIGVDSAGPRAQSDRDVSVFEQVRVPSTVSANEALDLIRKQLGDCTRCKLHKGRTTLVYGTGKPDADLMFVGEAPGRDEDRDGVPFVGRAGQLLTKIIESIGLKREDVYIANVIKCRPPDNRNPEPEEVRTCEPFLFAQIDAIQPRVVVALGSFAFRTLLREDRTPISKARGRVYNYRGAKLIPTFHPAFLLRSPNRKRDVWEDMKKVREILRGE